MEEQQPQKEKSPKKREKNNAGGFRDYARYSNMAFQMIIIILVTTWGGIKLDKLFELSTPVFTIVLSLFGVFAAIYIAVKDFIK